MIHRCENHAGRRLDCHTRNASVHEPSDNDDGQVVSQSQTRLLRRINAPNNGRALTLHLPDEYSPLVILDSPP